MSPTSRRQRQDEAMNRRVDRQMTDTRFDALRSETGRRVLVGLMCAWFVAIPVSWLLAGSIAGLLATVAAAATWWLLRVSVRTVADLPEEYLDERQADLRNRAYVDAYRLLAGLVVVLASAGLLAFVVQGEDAETWTVSLTWNGCMAVFWTVMAAALALPTMVVAARERPEQSAMSGGE